MKTHPEGCGYDTFEHGPKEQKAAGYPAAFIFIIVVRRIRFSALYSNKHNVVRSYSDDLQYIVGQQGSDILLLRICSDVEAVGGEKS